MSVVGNDGEASLDEFRDEVRTFFEERLPRRKPYLWGEGDDAVVGSAVSSDRHDADDFDAARRWQRSLADAGLAWLTGPTEHGGRGLTRAHAAAFSEIAKDYEVPDLTCLVVAHHIVAPALMAHGTTEQKERWLRPLFTGDALACQLFSEPDAGSDLAAIRCSAVREGDGWRINGQKVWTSVAHVSDVGELLVRTGPGERNRGLTMFLIDMHQPGVTVKPLRQINGSHHFNEVFLDDVLVTDDAMLGGLGCGWQVAMDTLASERDSVGDGDLGMFLAPVPRLLDLAAALGLADSALVRSQLADLYIRERIAALLPNHLKMISRDGGYPPGAESIVKLFSTATLQRIGDCASQLLGLSMVADTGAWGRYCWADLVLGVPAQRIAGGTDEVQRNILAERWLGLPRDPRPNLGKGPS